MKFRYRFLCVQRTSFWNNQGRGHRNCCFPRHFVQRRLPHLSAYYAFYLYLPRYIQSSNPDRPPFLSNLGGRLLPQEVLRVRGVVNQILFAPVVKRALRIARVFFQLVNLHLKAHLHFCRRMVRKLFFLWRMPRTEVLHFHRECLLKFAFYSLRRLRRCVLTLPAVVTCPLVA